jgi:hypothetical protein
MEPSQRMVLRAFRFSNEDSEFIDRMGGVEFLRELVAKARRRSHSADE